MAGPFVQGADAAITVYGIQYWFREMGLTVTIGERVIPVLELPDGFRIDDVFDAEMTFTAYHGSSTGQGKIQDLITAAINRVAPSALAWTDKAATPVSFLPTVFFTKFPVSTWRIARVDTGARESRDPLVASVTLRPKYAVYVP